MSEVKFEVAFTKEEVIEELKKKYPKNKKMQEIFKLYGNDAISFGQPNVYTYRLENIYCDFTCETSHSSDESYYVINRNYNLGVYVICNTKAGYISEDGMRLLANLDGWGNKVYPYIVEEVVKKTEDYAKQVGHRQFNSGITNFRVNEYTGDPVGDGESFEYAFCYVYIKTSLKNPERTDKIAIVYPSDINGNYDNQYLKVNMEEYEHKSGGCYVATCVYGSYDCPQVWTLRRYRDYKLAATRRGRLFIKIYYTISPKLVKMFGNTKWFKKMWRGKLDRMVEKYKNEGFEDTPYNDIDW